MPVIQAKEDKALVPVSGTRTVEKAEKAQSYFSIPLLPPRGLRRSWRPPARFGDYDTEM